VGLLARLGLKPTDVKVRFSSREVLAGILRELGITADQEPSAFVLLDRREKLDDADLEAMAFEFGITSFPFLHFLKRPRGASSIEASLEYLPLEVRAQINSLMTPLTSLMRELAAAGIGDWCELDLNIARGLAYYTGMVFEVHEVSGGMRAVAGGGRYDGLIETFGGPSTPAVGFGMGDVVLSLVLADRNLLPSEKQVAIDLGARPDVFIISNGTPEADGQVAGLVASARLAGLHARKSYKATKNIGKLLKDAGDLHSRYAVIIESATEATLKNLDTGTQDRMPIERVITTIKA
jgi:histidyl-tRNA synthetase